jgi:hypothetical protein
MKYIILMIMIPQILFGQHLNNLSVNLNGKKSLSKKKIFLESVGYGMMDSIISLSQSFDMSINPKENGCYRLLLDDNKTDFFFIENEDHYTIEVDIDTNHPSWHNQPQLESKITGGVYNQVFKKIKNTLYELVSLKLEATTAFEANRQDDSIYTFFVKVIQDNPFLGMVLLYDSKDILRTVQPRTENLKKYISLIESFDKPLRTHPLLKEVTSTFDSLNRLTPGGNIYDFSLINSKKEFIHTFDKRGQFLLILFAPNSCGYAQAQTKETLDDLIKNYEALKKLNFDILEVNMAFRNLEYDFRLIQSLDGIYTYRWENGYLFDNKAGRKILRDYNFLGNPRSFLYSKDGMLLEVDPTVQKILMHLQSNQK